MIVTLLNANYTPAIAAGLSKDMRLAEALIKELEFEAFKANHSADDFALAFASTDLEGAKTRLRFFTADFQALLPVTGFYLRTPYTLWGRISHILRFRKTFVQGLELVVADYTLLGRLDSNGNLKSGISIRPRN